MLATSTHDSKRSEDVRARLNVLSEIPFDWETRIAKWRRFNRAKRRRVGGRPVPSRAEEYLFYQTLVGTWPGADRADAMPEYRSRISDYMLKALREAKVNTSWAKQNERYEELVTTFVNDVLGDATRTHFVDDLDEFVRSIAVPGFLNGLGQTLLKLTSPGVPDVYQGNEVWDFSLVDPDNRRPVDYARRAALLEQIEDVAAEPARLPALLNDMLANLADGRAKLYATWRALRLRAERPELFELGSYASIEARGPRADHLCALSRRHGSECAIAIVGRWFASLPRTAGAEPATFDWLDTTVAIPPGVYRDVFSLETRTVEGDAGARVADLFARFPIALLVCADAA
jgi:(1->4)-alpha-D-glucan 1-alpha-D-glucosylmutase